MPILTSNRSANARNAHIESAMEAGMVSFAPKAKEVSPDSLAGRCGFQAIQDPGTCAKNRTTRPEIQALIMSRAGNLAVATRVLGHGFLLALISKAHEHRVSAFAKRVIMLTQYPSIHFNRRSLCEIMMVAGTGIKPSTA